jgi:hypothetical protein
MRYRLFGIDRGGQRDSSDGVGDDAIDLSSTTIGERPARRIAARSCSPQ